jgi:hypothetical protein
MSDPATPGKKGMPVIAWVGIGCGTIVVLCIIGFSALVGMCSRKMSEFKANPEKSAAELMVKMNPDLNVVSQDESKGVMTIRTKDGQEMTMSYKDVSKGQFTIKDAKGNVTQLGQSDLSNVPSWVPRVPGMKTANGSFQTQEGNKTSGVYNTTTTETADNLENSLKAEAEKLGLSSSNRSSFSADGTETRSLVYEGGGKKLSFIITSKAGEDGQVVVGYEESK